MRYVGKLRGCGGEMESRAHGAHEEHADRCVRND
jgi:hypothetical protein